MIIHYNFKCPNCGQEYLDLTEGTLCMGDDSIFQIYKCEKCKSLKDFSQHKSHTCKCGNDMILWDYKCPECGTLMTQEESGIYDCF